MEPEFDPHPRGQKRRIRSERATEVCRKVGVKSHPHRPRGGGGLVQASAGGLAELPLDAAAYGVGPVCRSAAAAGWHHLRFMGAVMRCGLHVVVLDVEVCEVLAVQRPSPGSMPNGFPHVHAVSVLVCLGGFVQWVPASFCEVLA